MRAAFITATGGPEVIQIGELPKPSPKPGEVLIKVAAASINPIDTYMRSGTVPIAAPLPYIVGCDFAGTIEEIGEGVKGLEVGQRVWGTNQGLLGRQGTFAEYIAVANEWIYPSPDNCSDTDLAACALVGITAHLGVFQFGDLREEDTIYINGGTGGVGSLAIQLAKNNGARVITTVGTEAKAEIARALGADLVINYKTDDVAARIEAFTERQGVNLWYETHREQDFDKIVKLMAPRGRIVVMAGRQSRPIFPVGPFYVKCLSLHGFAMFNCSPLEQIICSEEIGEFLSEGKLRPLIGLELPLEKAAEGHRVQESGLRTDGEALIGKIVVTIP